MIKLLKGYQVMLTPFQATKNWALSNNGNDEVLLTEDGIPIALEFLDYNEGSGSPVINSSCDIALEQQDDDKANLEIGQKGTGIFYPDTEPTNDDGTFKRTIFSQIQTTFYNAYRDPTKLWGIENIDFELSKNKRRLTDQFRLFDVPPTVFGDKIVPSTVFLMDNSLDNDYLITDDGNGNLNAGTNLFSKQQELGGPFTNSFTTGTSSACNGYWNLSPPPTPILAGTLSLPTGSLTWNTGSPTPLANGYALQKSFDGVLYFSLAFLPSGTFSYNDAPLSASVPYYYRIYAFNTFGPSPYSNVVILESRLDPLLDTSGSNYTSGPYDTFELYDTGSTPSSGGFGWASSWDMRQISAPDFYIIASMDTMDDYGPASQSIIIGLNSGSGWAGGWTGSM